MKSKLIIDEKFDYIAKDCPVNVYIKENRVAQIKRQGTWRWTGCKIWENKDGLNIKLFGRKI